MTGTTQRFERVPAGQFLEVRQGEPSLRRVSVSMR
jgi:hypothetical protein